MSMCRGAARRRMVGFLALALAAAGARAQEHRLDDRLDAQTAAEVMRIADSARLAGLPAQPLIDKALEGATKHAPDQRIVQAVRGFAQRLADARDALGSASSSADLVAAAGALYQGVSASDLRRLRVARPADGVSFPLVVLADLIARGVPPATATPTVLQLAERGAKDEEFAALRRAVEQDIAAGAPPAVAATTRIRGTLYALPHAGGAAGAAAGVGPLIIPSSPNHP